MWRRKFKLDNAGREPRVWLDRFCVDQSDVQGNLECLPVWLAGCNEIVALAGQSYTSRLWCLLEIYTFVEMGHEASALQLMPLQGVHMESLKQVSIRSAQCHDPVDKERLLAIAEAGFGSAEAFDAALGRILRAAKPPPPPLERSGRDRVTAASSAAARRSWLGSRKTSNS